ncbi:MAG TPA: ribosomal protein S18-alanine N-acetyltransferase [Gammaproteobacteria bacterium]|jgi:ribosomal-protein-alanine N-acetyltransferase|nr:ribosomal protein S18-alanine N-acetyltransferase [Gammaproteobacteria bacterium]
MSAVVAIAEPFYRPMQEADVRAVLEIERRAYKYHWTEGIFRDCLRVGYGCWVMELHGAIAGYGVLSLVVGEAHLLNICVAPEWQGKGYGGQLLEHFMDLARERSASQMLLEVRPSNAAALALYQKRGFNEVGLRKSYYPSEKGREDALILAIDLT